MIGNKDHRAAGRSVFMSSVAGIANTAAFIATFLLTPLAYDASDEWIAAFVSRQYSPGLVDPALVVWFIAVAAMTFFTARASLGLAITMGGLAIAARLF